jgi:glycosyltransferase involved in cell wall biosynthesis
LNDTNSGRETEGSGLHVLLVHQLFVSGNQAGGTRHWELARYLAAAGHRVTVIADRSSYLTGRAHAPIASGFEDEGVVVHRVRCLGGESFLGRVLRFMTFTAASFVRGLLVRDVDVVFGTTPPLPQATTALSLARLRGVPFLLEVRDLWPDFAVELGVLSDPGVIAASRRVERALYRAADVVVANSPGFVKHLRASGAGRVEVIPNGVDPDAFVPEHDGAEFRRQHDLTGKFVALYAGAHGIPNDLGTILDAAEELESSSEVVFVLVGDGRDKARQVADASRRNLVNVRFIDPQPKSRMKDVLAAADVGLATLRPLAMFKTVYPNKVFDYMAAGRPTVLQIDGVIRSVVEESDGGCYVPPGDSRKLAEVVARYAADPALRQRQGRSARAAVEARFRRSDQAEALAELLAGLRDSEAS